MCKLEETRTQTEPTQSLRAAAHRCPWRGDRPGLRLRNPDWTFKEVLRLWTFSDRGCLLTLWSGTLKWSWFLLHNTKFSASKSYLEVLRKIGGEWLLRCLPGWRLLHLRVSRLHPQVLDAEVSELLSLYYLLGGRRSGRVNRAQETRGSWGKTKECAVAAAWTTSSFQLWTLRAHPEGSTPVHNTGTEGRGVCPTRQGPAKN